MFGPKQTQTLAQPTSPQPEADIEVETPLDVEKGETPQFIDTPASPLVVKASGTQGLGGLLASYSSSDESEKADAEEEVEHTAEEEVVKEQEQDSRPVIEEKWHDSGTVIDEKRQDTRVAEAENDPPILREDIEVVEIDYDVGKEVDQPVTGAGLEDWTILRTLDSEPHIEEDDNALRRRLRIIQRALFDEPDTTGIEGTGETASPVEEVNPQVGGSTPLETRQEAPPTGEEEVETEEASLKRKRIREEKTAMPVKKMGRLANRAVVIREPIEAVNARPQAAD